MIEKHHAGIIENWDGVQQAPEAQIRAARESGDAQWAAPPAASIL
jgi:hypothetical protein